MRVPGPLSSLGSRLTDPGDRQAYADLVTYFDSLPPGDELFKVSQMLGFLSLLGQRIPVAVEEVLGELRGSQEMVVEYHEQLQVALDALPKEIAKGVDLDAIGKAMGESFRQQIMKTGLVSAVAIMKAAVTSMGEVTEHLQPLTDLGREARTALGKVREASAELKQCNAAAVEREEKQRVWVLCLAGAGLFLAGSVVGVVIVLRMMSHLLGR